MLALLAGDAAQALFFQGEADCEIGVDVRRSPASRVPLEKGLALWRRLPTVTGRESIGLALAPGPGILCFHYFGIAFASAPHLLGAIQVFARHFPFLCQVNHIFEYSRYGETVLGWEDSADVAPRSLRDYVLATLLHALREYPWQPVRPVRVELSGPGPEQLEPYRKAFECPVSFQPARSRVVFNTANLAVPLRGTNPEIHQQMSFRLATYDLMAASIAQRVCGTLERLLDEGSADLGAVAKALGSSPRTLQSHLAREGYRFADLLLGVRQRRALRLVSETNMPMKSIAYSLGYQNEGSFQRAFRAWFSTHPSALRSGYRDDESLSGEDLV